MSAALIGAGLSLASALATGLMSGEHNRNYRRMIKGELADNDRWHNVKMSEDYTLRTDNQANINKLREALMDADKATRKRQVVSGGTDESVAMQKENINKAVSDATVNMAMQASAEKDQADREYRRTKAALTQQLASSEQQQAQQIAQAGSQAVNAGLNLVGNSLAMQGGGSGVPQGAGSGVSEKVIANLENAKTAPVNTDLTSAGNAQMGFGSTPAPINLDIPKYRVTKMDA